MTTCFKFETISSEGPVANYLLRAPCAFAPDPVRASTKRNIVMPKNMQVTASARPTPDTDRLVHALLLIIRARAEAQRAKEARHEHTR